MTEITIDALGLEIQKHFNNKTYAEGLALASKQLKEFPNNFPLLTYWRICFAARMNALPQANQILEALLSSGIWYSEALLRESPSLDALQKDPEFERLAGISLKMQISDPLEKLPLLVVRPENMWGPGQESGCPNLVFLHGNRDNAQANLSHWHPLSKKGWLVALPQSSQVYWSENYSWTAHEMAENEVLEKYNGLSKQYSLDTQNTVIAGFSMGAEIALALALNVKLNSQGFILLGPGGPYMNDLSRWDDLIEIAKDTGLRGVVLMGLEDKTIPQNAIRELVEKLNKRGIPTDLQTFPGLGHQYPENFEVVLDKALSFIKN